MSTPPWRRLLYRGKDAVEYLFARAEMVFQRNQPLIVVTAASDTYFLPARRLLRSLSKHESHCTRFGLFDLGLSAFRKDQLQNEFPTLQFHSIDLTASIPWVDMSINAGGYAWKPLFIEYALDFYGANILWLDASVVVTRRLARVRNVLRRRGFFCCVDASHSIGELTHSDTIRLLDGSHFVDNPMVMGGVFGIRRDFTKGIELLNNWRKFVGTEPIGSPVGADTTNHRFDQSILSILVYREALLNHDDYCSDFRFLDFYVDNNRKTMFEDGE